MSRYDLPPDDELASAYLDGELDDDARTRVEADPVLLAEVSELRRVRELVAGLPAPAVDPARRDEALRAALGALDGVVVPFAPVARPARRFPRWALPAIGAAAAALVVALGVARHDAGTPTNDVASAPTTAVVAPDGSERQATAEAGGAAPQPVDAAGPTVAAAATAPAYAKVAPPSEADLAALTEATSAALRPGATLPATGAAASDAGPTCSPPTPGAVYRGPLAWSTGIAVELYVDATATPRTGWAVAVEGCQVLGVVTLA